MLHGALLSMLLKMLSDNSAPVATQLHLPLTYRLYMDPLRECKAPESLRLDLSDYW